MISCLYFISRLDSFDLEYDGTLFVVVAIIASVYVGFYPLVHYISCPIRLIHCLVYNMCSVLYTALKV